MKTTLFLAACAVAATAATAQAQGWSRNSETIGPNGGEWTFQGEGRCASGRCESRQQWVGPRGGVVTRQGSTACSNGACEGAATFTDRRGRSWTRTRSFRRNR